MTPQEEGERALRWYEEQKPQIRLRGTERSVFLSGYWLGKEAARRELRTASGDTR